MVKKNSITSVSKRKGINKKIKKTTCNCNYKFCTFRHKSKIIHNCNVKSCTIHHKSKGARDCSYKFCTIHIHKW